MTRGFTSARSLMDGSLGPGIISLTVAHEFPMGECLPSGADERSGGALPFCLLSDRGVYSSLSCGFHGDWSSLGAESSASLPLYKSWAVVRLLITLGLPLSSASFLSAPPTGSVVRS
jgi:hypothetical protein